MYSLDVHIFILLLHSSQGNLAYNETSPSIGGGKDRNIYLWSGKGTGSSSVLYRVTVKAGLVTERQQLVLHGINVLC